MNCKRYQDTIREAALGTLSAARSMELNAHLVGCARCRSEFEREQRLIAAVNRGLAASVSGQPSPELAARVRMRLAVGEERTARRTPWTWSPPALWIPVSVAVLSALLLAVWFVRRPSDLPGPETARIASRPTAPGPVARMNGSSEQTRLTPQPRTPSGPGPRSQPAGASRADRRRQASPETQQPRLQVQIQPGQWAAVTSLYRAGQAGLLKGAQDQPASAEQPLQVKPVEVAPLVVAELQDPKPVGTDDATVQDR